MSRQTILIVDDNSINRDMISIIFERNYDIITAKSGAEAISIINSLRTKISAIFLDIVMPEVDGIDVLKYISSEGLTNKIPVLMITGNNSIEVQSLSYELGASDFIYKPFIPKIISRKAKNLIELFSYKNNIEESLKEAEKEIKETDDFLTDALSTIVEFRNLESGKHIKRVKSFTNIIANAVRDKYNDKYNLTEEDVELITRASVLHDIGKIGIPDSILLKPGKLTDEEFAEMKKHTIYGSDLLVNFIREGKDNKFYEYANQIARYHHERYDGGGYPDHLSGDDIPISAQIVSIADVFDALTSKRCYKDAYDYEKSISMINDDRCGVFSNKILNCFNSSLDSIIDISKELEI